MNIFKSTRIRLTFYYLIIITVISTFFSLIIYNGATAELRRIENFERRRSPILDEVKDSIALRLFYLNLIILGISGVSGYFLAGKTLSPIAKMMDEQKEFVSNASHELRTPLASLKSQIEVTLRDPKLKLSDAKKLLTSNLEDVNNMTKLSNYLLKLNKQQNAELKFKKVDLAEIIKENQVKSGIKFNLEKTIVYGDKDSLKELVNILVDNAIKYGEGKEVSISLRNKVLKITDHGIGISESDLPHIFDRFFRGDKARSHDGYGLGLSIAKQIVDNHNAKIKVESKLGVGTTFTLIF